MSQCIFLHIINVFCFGLISISYICIKVEWVHFQGKQLFDICPPVEQKRNKIVPVKNRP